MKPEDNYKNNIVNKFWLKESKHISQLIYMSWKIIEEDIKRGLSSFNNKRR